MLDETDALNHVTKMGKPLSKRKPLYLLDTYWSWIFHLLFHVSDDWQYLLERQPPDISYLVSPLPAMNFWLLPQLHVNAQDFESYSYTGTIPILEWLTMHTWTTKIYPITFKLNVSPIYYLFIGIQEKKKKTKNKKQKQKPKSTLTTDNKGNVE